VHIVRKVIRRKDSVKLDCIVL